MTATPNADDLKRQAALHAIEYVRDGMIVGLGTGSTSTWAVRLLGEKVAAGLKIRAVPTSDVIAALARELGIPLVEFDAIWGSTWRSTARTRWTRA